MHRTQLYFRLKRRAGAHESITGVVRDLIDAARARRPRSDGDPLIRFLAEERPADSSSPSTVETLDTDLYR